MISRQNNVDEKRQQILAKVRASIEVGAQPLRWPYLNDEKTCGENLICLWAESQLRGYAEENWGTREYWAGYMIPDKPRRGEEPFRLPNGQLVYNECQLEGYSDELYIGPYDDEIILRGAIGLV